MSNFEKGIFTISLDFELHWGVSDHRTVESYRENLENVPRVVERLLDVFSKNGIRATWATVGMLFCQSKTEIEAAVSPSLRPTFSNPKLSNFNLLPEIGETASEDPFHYAPQWVKKIAASPGQELATHTFSHYYCLERGTRPEQFDADLRAARQLIEKQGVAMRSIVFPRNQYDGTTIEICQKNGLVAFRGNERHWMYEPRNREQESALRRAARLVDAYLKISGDNTHGPDDLGENPPFNVPSSRFLRPYSPKLAVLEPLRLARFKNEMTVAARKKRIYHLWWHPHNFGKHLEENFKVLTDLLQHYQKLKAEYGMTSLSMAEIAALKTQNT